MAPLYLREINITSHQCCTVPRNRNGNLETGSCRVKSKGVQLSPISTKKKEHFARSHWFWTSTWLILRPWQNVLWWPPLAFQSSPKTAVKRRHPPLGWSWEDSGFLCALLVAKCFLHIPTCPLVQCCKFSGDKSDKKLFVQYLPYPPTIVPHHFGEQWFLSFKSQVEEN